MAQQFCQSPAPTGSAAQVHVSVPAALPFCPPSSQDVSPQMATQWRGGVGWVVVVYDTAGGAPLWVPAPRMSVRLAAHTPRQGQALHPLCSELPPHTTPRPLPVAWGYLQLPGQMGLWRAWARLPSWSPGAGLGHISEPGRLLPIYKWGWLVPTSQGCVSIK